MTYSDSFNIRTKNVKFNDIADALDGIITRGGAGTTTGVANAYIATPNPSWTSYDTSALLVITPHASNTGASTINVSSLGAKSIKRSGADISAGALVAGTPTILVYTGTVFEILVAENALARDGTNSATANINLGGNIFTNVGAGTASAPAFCAGNDSNTGIFSPSADNWAISTNGSERIRIDSSGNLGVGVSSPQNSLDIQCASSNAVGVVSRGRSSDDISVKLFTNYANSEVARIQCSPTAMELQKSGNNPVVISTNGVNRVNITGSGNVGIGQTSPTRPLHIGDGTASTYLKIQGSTSGTAGGSAIEIGTSGNIGNASATLGGAFDNTLMLWANTNPISLYTSGAHRLYVTTGGNVGVGTTSPTDLFTVGNGTTTISASINGSTSGTGGGQGLNFGSIGRIGNYSRVVGGAYNAAFTFRSLGAVSLIADSGGFSMAGLTGNTGGSVMKWNTSTGAWFYDTSAARYKENIRDSTLGLATVKALRPRQYNYVYEGKPEDVGFVAEEVEPILPYLVSKNADGQCESITYDRLTSVLVKAVQELSEQVDSLKARIEALEGV